MVKPNKIIIGRLESINLPDLSIENLQVRVDTGAKTSSLHVDNIKKFSKKGKPFIRFDLHPELYDIDKVITCESAISDIRMVKSSNGASEERYVIETRAVLGSETWDIEITLTDRSDMNYLMLFGRQAIGDKFLVDPSKVFLGSDSA